MFSMLRNRLHVSPATVIASVALVFAMTGGAYAAKKYLITSTKQISPSVLKSLRGKAGANGAPGAAGPQGPAGAQGPAGGKGETGPAGTPGKDGAPGKAGATGREGATGKEGSPWTAGGLLPSHATETGTWAASANSASGTTAFAAISFPLPLAEEPKLIFVLLRHAGPAEEPLLEEHSPGEEQLREAYEEGAEHGCPGFKDGVPLAAPGTLCVYGSYLANMEPTATPIPPTKLAESQVYEGGAKIAKPDGAGATGSTTAAPTGVALEVTCGAGLCKGLGAWAVTAE